MYRKAGKSWDLVFWDSRAGTLGGRRQHCGGKRTSPSADARVVDIFGLQICG